MKLCCTRSEPYLLITPFYFPNIHAPAIYTYPPICGGNEWIILSFDLNINMFLHLYLEIRLVSQSKIFRFDLYKGSLL